MHFIEIEIYGKFEICFVSKDLRVVFIKSTWSCNNFKRHDFHTKDWNLSQQQTTKKHVTEFLNEDIRWLSLLRYNCVVVVVVVFYKVPKYCKYYLAYIFY